MASSFASLVASVTGALLIALNLCASTAFAQVYSTDSGGGISCYVCQSINGSNPNCQDPFDASTANLITQCVQGRKDQRGTFPARFCYKLKGIRKSDGQEVIVRRCSVDPLVTNVPKSHCGGFKIMKGQDKQELYDGCVSMCRFDGCNPAGRVRGPGEASLVSLASLLLASRGLIS